MWGKELGPDLKAVLPKSIKLCATKSGRNFVANLRPPLHPACEWSRGAASDIDGQAERPKRAGANESIFFAVRIATV